MGRGKTRPVWARREQSARRSIANGIDRSLAPIHQLTAAKFEKLFPDESACCAYLVARRWAEGVRCPRCGNPDIYDASSYKSFHCRACAPDGYRFSVIAGTIFENTNKPLRGWYRVIHLMLVSKKGMSALQLYRYMGFGSYKTA